jgi:hypothetical protein
VIEERLRAADRERRDEHVPAHRDGPGRRDLEARGAEDVARFAEGDCAVEARRDRAHVIEVRVREQERVHVARRVRELEPRGLRALSGAAID